MAGIAGHDCVIRQVAHQFADHPLRQDRLVVRHVGGRVEEALCVAVTRDAPYIGVVMLAIALVFVWRSFYAMRIPKEKALVPDDVDASHAEPPQPVGH